MLNIFNWFISIIGGLMSYIYSSFTQTIFGIIRQYVPNINNYFSVLNNYINNYLLKGLQFAKMCFLNISNINHNIWNIFTFCLMSLLLGFTTFLAGRLAYNIWRTVQGTNSGK